MILVDVFVPAVDKQFDFCLDENRYIADILEEIGMIVFGAGEDMKERMQSLILCDYNGRRILPMNQTLKMNGIGNGYRLVIL